MTSRVEYFKGDWMESDVPDKVKTTCPDCGQEQYVDIMAKIITCGECGNDPGYKLKKHFLG